MGNALVIQNVAILQCGSSSTVPSRRYKHTKQTNLRSLCMLECAHLYTGLCVAGTSQSHIKRDYGGAAVPVEFALCARPGVGRRGGAVDGGGVVAPGVRGGQIGGQVDVRHLPRRIEVKVRALQRRERVARAVIVIDRCNGASNGGHKDGVRAIESAGKTTQQRAICEPCRVETAAVRL